ncbi:phosphate ABC transporter permease subunit PstC [Euzebya sp.]|uniref:phosphate ABC transporter permease subunit PstC n=1 Tax=Euzebya sp. TaxID=1971409 RepID=UPI0035150383
MRTPTTSPAPESPASVTAERSTKGADRLFAGLSTGAGVTILLLLAGVAFFLFQQSLPALSADPSALAGGADSLGDFLGPLVFGTVYAAVLALLLATPLAVAIALFISHYAPRRLATTLGYITDILAAVPSVVYGLWGVSVLAPLMVPLMRGLEERLGVIPLFAGPTLTSGRTLMVAAVVLAVMILPIITAICREIFLQVPRLHEEAALALGATRWELIKMAVLPYARSGIISGTMLGLGRALGETMALAIILSPARIIDLNIIGAQNPQAIAPNIALRFPESSGIEVNGLFLTGLVLFAITFAVNYGARRITANAFSGAD